MRKLLVAACILFSSVSAFANDNEDNSVVAKFKVTTNKTTKMANLTFIPSTEEKVTVKIMDAQGNIIFREQILNKEGFIRPYNLSQLNGAEYSIEVTEGKTVYTEKISIGTEKLDIVSKNLSTKASRINANTVELKVFQNAINPVTIKVQDQIGNVIYKATVNEMISFVQKYNLLNVKGEVSFEVKSGSESEIIIL